ncbi:MAG: ATP-dependent Clp protease proteolytic subunit [Clostridia bacterium]|nr:ATP-dependent Clp protease proteolytic subunit [Clostridia bacterium]
MSEDINAQEERQDDISEYGIIETENSHGRIRSLNIIGTIEGHSLLPSGTKTTKYEHVLPQLVAVEEDDDIDGLLILLNTVGGDVEAGLAIAEMISGMSKPTVSLVLGGSHSIGVPLAVAADKSFISPSSTMTLHPMRINGVVIGVMQTFRYLAKMQDRIIDFIVRNSNIEYDTFKQMMLATDEIANDVGTVLFGEQAVECGLIDAVGGVSDALRALYELIGKKDG